MSNKILLIVLGAVSVMILVGYFALGFSGNDKKDSSIESNPQVSQEVQPDNNQEVKTYSEAEVAKNNTPESCWTIIDNKVYDLTKYIVEHPGGSEIERACGIDASSYFNSRRSEDGQSIGSGTPHSQRAKNELTEFYIGDLK